MISRRHIFQRRLVTQHNNTLRDNKNVTQHNKTQYNDKNVTLSITPLISIKCGTQHNNTQYKNKNAILPSVFNVILQSVVMHT